jgi:hypothetical protein
MTRSVEEEWTGVVYEEGKSRDEGRNMALEPLYTITFEYVRKVKLSLQQAMKAQTFMRRPVSHIM